MVATSSCVAHSARRYQRGGSARAQQRSCGGRPARARSPRASTHTTSSCVAKPNSVGIVPEMPWPTIELWTTRRAQGRLAGMVARAAVVGDTGKGAQISCVGRQRPFTDVPGVVVERTKGVGEQCKDWEQHHASPGRLRGGRYRLGSGRPEDAALRHKKLRGAHHRAQL
eukprot:887154-Prymnesium_polylepis.1